MLEHICRVASRVGDIAAIYTMFADDEGIASFPDSPDGVRHVKRVVRSALGSLPGAGKLRRWMLPAYPLAVADLSKKLARDHAREPIDLLISTSSAAIKGVRPPGGVPHICYCHAPARYLWSLADEYATGSGGGLRSLGLNVFGESLRRWDRKTAANVTTFLANSTHTQGEIKRCYGRDAQVVFPPVDTHFYTPDASAKRSAAWLYVGALEPYKRVDAVIDAAVLAGAELVIVGKGSQEAHLRTHAAAHPNTRMLGHVPLLELRKLYQTVGVLVFPQIEDFGIVAVEAQACGLPVAARGKGGALDSVVPGVTGALFSAPALEQIAKACDACLKLGDVTQACVENAKRFSIEAFESRVRSMLP